MEEYYPNKTERKNNVELFKNLILPKLHEKNYKILVINEKTNHFRINKLKKTIDYYPARGRLCFLEYNEWVTVLGIDNIMLSITTYLELQ